MNSVQEEMDLLDGCVSMRLHQMGLEELPLGSRFNADLNPILLAALAIENVKRPACYNTFALGLTNAHHNALVKEANPFPRRYCAEILALSTQLIDRRFSHQPNFYSTAGQQI